MRVQIMPFVSINSHYFIKNAKMESVSSLVVLDPLVATKMVIAHPDNI